MYIFVKSDDSLQIFPFNTNSHFYVKLSEELSFNNSNKFALYSITLPSFASNNSVREILVLVNVAKESYIGSTKLPIVQRYVLTEDKNHLNVLFGNEIYVNMKNIHTDVIEITLIDGDTLDLIKFNSGKTYCTFHIKR